MTAGLAVEARDLTKRFDGQDRPAVDDVSVATTEGEYLVLLGPSGCGKTTLLRMIAGLEQPTTGDILIGGDVVTHLPPRARRIAMVFQSYALYPHKTVRQNIAFPLRAAKIPADEQAKKIEWAAGLLGLEAMLDRRPRHLSGGERQRVALARALVREPSVFLLDEPLSNLDAKLRTSARNELKDFHARVGTTTIYVTHDQVEAMGMGDRIVVMLDGQVRQVGRPLEVYERPADTFVATFLGAPPMNLVRADDAIVGFRPEKMLPASVLEGGSRDGYAVAQLDVSRIEHLSGDRHLHGRLTGLGEETPVIVRLPAIVYIVALVAVPFFVAIAYSVSDVSAGDPSFDYVGLRQYRAALADGVFRKSLGNTLVFTAASMALVVVLGRALATVLVSDFRGKWLVRMLVLLPWTTPVALATVNWLWLLDSLFSPIDWVLREIGWLGVGGHTVFLGKPGLARASVIAVHAWRLIPLAAVIIMAGLSAIPQDIRDAAAVDGAGRWRTFREVTLPLTLPVMAVATLFGSILTFTDLSVVRVLTNGGPVHSTQVLASWAYQKGIGGGDLAQGAAVALFLFPLLLAAAVLILRAVRRMEVF